MPKFATFEFEPGTDEEASSAAQAVENAHTIRQGREYVAINTETMEVTWIRGVVAAYNRNTQKVEPLNGIG